MISEESEIEDSHFTDSINTKKNKNVLKNSVKKKINKIIENQKDFINSMEFRVSSKTVFLTYFRCNIPIDWFFNYLITCNRWSVYVIEEIMLCTEFYEDGRQDIYAILQFKKKLDTRNPHFFDIQICTDQFEKDGSSKMAVFYGIFVGVRCLDDSMDYLVKKILNLEVAVQCLRITKGFSRRLTRICSYLSLYERMIFLANQGFVGYAMELLKLEDPSQYIINGSSIEKRLQDIYVRKLGCTLRYDFSSIIVPDELVKVLDIFERSLRADKNSVLLLQSVGGIYKTEFLKCYFESRLQARFFFASSKENFKHFNSDIHKVVLFDDLFFDFKDSNYFISLVASNSTLIKLSYNMLGISPHNSRTILINNNLLKFNTAFFKSSLNEGLIYVILDSKYRLYEKDINFTSEEFKVKKKLVDLFKMSKI